ncbi:amino acid ABC transporter ATP-binding protein [Pseudomonas sp. A-R-19]|uniref:amino acid ABC transporter ATP-binding protein n=1 Tax=Pseudomonas sp. A-R-19 TaxID=2832403 RepID=UPI001CC09E13|nr:amino acid ABC transporter ATP-binding protein [Pseudomonas sp. A-R-19]
MQNLSVLDKLLIPEATKASPVIEVQGLSKHYGSVQVLKEINLSIEPGEVVAVIGPSGSGKSTLLRCINQLEPAEAGTVTVAGLTIKGGVDPDRSTLQHFKRNLGMVFQSFNLFPHLTVLENITLAQRRVLGRTTEVANERAMSLLKRVGLEQKASQYPARCSGGQQQRIAICRALALDPKIMLFDEPTSALDPEVGLEVLAVMRELAQDGMTMMIVTHEMSFAEDVSNRVIVMADGKIIEEGTSSRVMRHSENERVKQFLSAVRNR